MHKEIFSLYDDFKEEFLQNDKKIKILEVGSKLGRAGLLRDRSSSKWEYIGLDVLPGRNVDIVSEDPYSYPLEDNSFDVVLSTSTAEHVKDMFSWIKEVARVAKDLVWIVAPNTYPEHGRLDYWRIMPKGMLYLLDEVAGLEIIRVEKSKHNPVDTVGIARKK